VITVQVCGCRIASIDVAARRFLSVGEKYYIFADNSLLFPTVK